MKLVFRNINEIGPTFKRIRLNKGYSLRKISLKTGLNLSTISKAETGNNYPSMGTLQAWCKALDVSEITITMMEDPDAN